MKTGDDPRQINEIHGISVGIFEEKRYDQSLICPEPEDFIFMYTDGFTNSRNEKKELFGDQRLAGLILFNKKSRVENIVEAAFTGVGLFEGDTDQYDDITVMALKYQGM